MHQGNPLHGICSRFRQGSRCLAPGTLRPLHAEMVPRFALTLQSRIFQHKPSARSLKIVLEGLDFSDALWRCDRMYSVP